MMFGRGYNGFNSCYGLGPRFMNGGGGMIIMLILIALTVFAVIYFTKMFSRNKPSNETAVERLKMRLVNGEITEEEYNKIKNALK